MPLTVTVTDETGTVLGTQEVPDDDYFVLTTGRCWTKTQTFANGTHVLTFKGRAALAQSTPTDTEELG